MSVYLCVRVSVHLFICLSVCCTPVRNLMSQMIQGFYGMVFSARYIKQHVLLFAKTDDVSDLLHLSCIKQKFNSGLGFRNTP